MWILDLCWFRLYHKYNAWLNAVSILSTLLSTFYGLHFELNVCLIIPQARTDYLRKKSRAALQQTGEWTEDGEAAETSRGAREIEHLNLFPLEDSSEKKGNAEYLKEKMEEKVWQKD